MSEAAAVCVLAALLTLAEGAGHSTWESMPGAVPRRPSTNVQKHLKVIRAAELLARAYGRHLVVGVAGEDPQRGGGVLLLLRRAVSRERHERLNAARARNRHLVRSMMRHTMP